MARFDRRYMWKTREGKVLWVTEMDDSHLMNTIRYLERRAAQVVINREMNLLHLSAFLQGEIALQVVEEELMQVPEPQDWLWDHHPTYPRMLEVAFKRGILPKEHRHYDAVQAITVGDRRNRSRSGKAHLPRARKPKARRDKDGVPSRARSRNKKPKARR